MIWILSLLLASGASVELRTPYPSQGACEVQAEITRHRAEILAAIHQEYPQRVVGARCIERPALFETRR